MWPFKNKSFESLENEKKELERMNESLREDREKLKEEVADLKLEKKIGDEDIKHMIKMQTEAMELDFNKREVKADGVRAVDVAKVKDEYRDKMEKQLSKETENIKLMYGQILERLPNITASITGKV